MTSAAIVRPERPADHAVIASVIKAAFTGMPYADGDEHELVDTKLLRGRTPAGPIYFHPAFHSDA